jgi:hypothetical protein
MTTAPQAALLRLREADIVRLCGFAGAARGLELADRHAVSGGKREGSSLQASVADESPWAVTVEVPDTGAVGAMRWTCAAHPHAVPGDLGCAHVAALLTAWIRAPSDFPSQGAPALPEAAPTPPPSRPQVMQPALLASSRSDNPRGSSRGSSRGASLEDELTALPTTELLAIARRVLGTELVEHEARAQLKRMLADAPALSALLARLDAGPRQLFAWLQLLGGALTASDLDALAVRAERAPSSMRADIAVLARHGLVFPAPGTNPASGDGQRSWRGFSGWRIPPELRAAVAPWLPLDPLPAREPNGPPLVGLSHESTADRPRGLRVARASLRPLCLALALLARAPAPLGPFDGDRGAEPTPFTRHRAAPSALDERRASSAHLSRVSPGRIAALARAAGLDPAAAALARRLLLLANESAPGQRLADLARVPLSERIAALHAGFQLWRDAESAAELADLEVARAQVRARRDSSHAAFRPGAIGAEVAHARRFVLRLLGAAASNAWYGLDEFIALVWRLDPLFLRGRQQPYEMPSWWLERTGEGNGEGVRRPLRPSVREEWMAGEGAYLRLLLTGPLRAWGALELASDPAGHLVAFRLTPFGRLALRDREDIQRAELDALLAGEWGSAVLPTRDGSLAMQPLAAGADLLDVLDRWALPASVAGGRLIYALSSDRASAAFDRSYLPDELPRHLRAVDPQGGERCAELVARRLGEWHATYGATRIQDGWALLEARDEPALVETLALVAGLAARCRRLDATHALIPAEDVAALQALLARRGYTV